MEDFIENDDIDGVSVFEHFFGDMVRDQVAEYISTFGEFICNESNDWNYDSDNECIIDDSYDPYEDNQGEEEDEDEHAENNLQAEPPARTSSRALRPRRQVVRTQPSREVSRSSRRSPRSSNRPTNRSTNRSSTSRNVSHSPVVRSRRAPRESRKVEAVEVESPECEDEVQEVPQRHKRAARSKAPVVIEVDSD